MASLIGMNCCRCFQSLCTAESDTRWSCIAHAHVMAVKPRRLFDYFVVVVPTADERGETIPAVLLPCQTGRSCLLSL